MYGRQLATVMERYSKDLRLKFGKTERWEARLAWCVSCRISFREAKREFCHCGAQLWRTPTLLEAEKTRDEAILSAKRKGAKAEMVDVKDILPQLPLKLRIIELYKQQWSVEKIARDVHRRTSLVGEMINELREEGEL